MSTLRRAKDTPYWLVVPSQSDEKHAAHLVWNVSTRGFFYELTVGSSTYAWDNHAQQMVLPHRTICELERAGERKERKTLVVKWKLEKLMREDKGWAQSVI